jgi:nicotinamidase-related amidase
VIGCGGVAGGVDDTARQAAPLGYEVTVVADATYPVDEYQLACLDHKADVKTSGEVLGFLQNRTWRFESSERQDQPGKNFALLVIDLQNDSIHPQGANALYGGSKLTAAEFDMVVGNNQKLMAAMRKEGYAVIHTLPEYRPDEIDFCGAAPYYRRRSAEMPRKLKRKLLGNEFVGVGRRRRCRSGKKTNKRSSSPACCVRDLDRAHRDRRFDQGLRQRHGRDGIALGYQMLRSATLRIHEFSYKKSGGSPNYYDGQALSPPGIRLSMRTKIRRRKVGGGEAEVKRQLAKLLCFY